MKQSLKQGVLPLLLGAALLLGGCQTATDADLSSNASLSPERDGHAAIDASTLFSDRDMDGSYDENTTVQIKLEGDGVYCASDAVAIDGTRITLLDEGTYLVFGNLTDGQIVVNADNTDKVQIVLAGVDIACGDSAAIYALEADKVFLTLAEGTENSLSNGGEYVAVDENNIDAVIFSKTDLTLNGSGSLTIDAGAGHGVVSKDELTVAGGSYTITAASHGMTGKDSLSIASGSFAITSGKDGLHAENTDDLSLGSLYIADGSFTIAAQGDAISASGALEVDGGDFELTTGGGSASVAMPSGDSFAPGGMGGMTGGHQGQRPQRGQPPTEEGSPQRSDSLQDTQPLEPPIQEAVSGQQDQAASEVVETDTVSQKGLKAEGALTINEGLFAIDSADDCIHAGGALTITTGEFTLSSGDDAIHSDGAVTIWDGIFAIPYCYEGIEGLSITVEGGNYDIVSHDDGLNAAGGADSSGFGGGRDQFSASADSFITINGGVFTIVSDGDCIDSNGDLIINGGTLDLTCNDNGNTALDADGTYTNNGGDLTTNDGSESNPGGMAGGRPAGGGPGDEQPSGDRMQPSGQ